MPSYDPPAPIISGLRCRCPRCGEGKLFRGFLTVAKECDACGLDYSFADPADGPAFFGMSGVGTVGLGLFMVFDFTVHPPIWVHLVVTLPILVAMCLGCLRPFKAWLVAEQFIHKAAPPEFSSNGKHGPF